jgi:hypothetical protein
VRGVHPRSRGAPFVGFVQEEGSPRRGGCTKERGHTCPRASPNISSLLQGGRIYKWVKAKASQSKGKQKAKEAKGLARKEGCTKANGTFIHGLAGTSTRDSKASKIGCYCTRFNSCNFACCIYALRSPNNNIYSKPVFPMGSFSRVMLTKNPFVVN